MGATSMKLYRYFEDYGRMGVIEGLLILTEAQMKRYQKNTGCLCWDELLGKHSEGTFDFVGCCSEIPIPEDVVRVLFQHLGSEVSGPFNLEYFDECIDEKT
jgi:hypothetical protein